MQFTREDLDRTLESRRTAVSRLAATLLELDAERERRAPEAQGLVGASATAWRQGSEVLVSMWVAYQELSEKLAAVEAERAARPLSRDALTRIGSALLTPGTQSEISELSARLEQTAETMTAIWAARDLALPRLDEIERRLAGAGSAARRAGTRMPNAVVSLRDRLPDLRRQVTRDPLSVPPEEARRSDRPGGAGVRRGRRLCRPRRGSGGRAGSPLRGGRQSPLDRRSSSY